MSKPTPSPAGNEHIQEEALTVARSIQKPGQTKEQTRLIAQGIAKGIEQYKRQQSAKSRERDRLRKRLQKEKQTAQDSAQTGHTEADTGYSAPARSVLIFSGATFLTMSVFHIARLLSGWDVSINGWFFPSWASLLAVLGLGTLAAWAFVTARRLY